MTATQSALYAELYETVLVYRKSGFVSARKIIGRLANSLGLTVNQALMLGTGPGDDNLVADLVTYGQNGQHLG